MREMAKGEHPKCEKKLEIPEKCEKADGFCETLFSEEYCAALDNSNVSIYIIDPESFEMVFCNRALRKNFDQNPSGMLCYKVLTKQDTPCADCAAMRLYRNGDNEPKEFFNHSTGTWGLLHSSMLHLQGRDFVQITCVDITRQKELEAELRLMTKEYGAVARQSTSGIMRYDIATGTASVNVDSRLNRVDEYVIPNYTKVIRDSGIIEQDSLPTAKEMFEDICSGVPSKGYDLRLNAQGRLCWSHLDYALIKDDAGKPYRAVVSFYDNTEKRERELAYQRWNARLNTFMNDYTAYMEVDVSRDIIESEGKAGSWDKNTGGRSFSEFAENMEMDEIFVDDRLNFQKFFNRERLLGQFYAGVSEGSLEYRNITSGEPRWHKAELLMASDPSSGNVKASIVFSNVDVNMRERESLKSKAEQDIMTGIYNHATAERLIGTILEQNTGERCCFLIIDLDDLRVINSLLGHPEGDRALKAIAGAMRETFGKQDILGRIGGDEFVVFLRDVSEESELTRLVLEFRQKLNETNIGPMNDKPVHASVGGAVGIVGEDDFETLYERADLALYYTKAMGKNGFNLYEPELEKREFSYQPDSGATLNGREWYESAEFKNMMGALSVYFPLVISANLTQNTYYMMEYMTYAVQKAKDQGCYDHFIVDGAYTFHPEDKEDFLKCFARENLLQAYAEGKKTVEHTARQQGDDGIYRLVKTIAVFMKDENTGDICEVSFSHVITEDVEG